jgi:mannosyltransferase
MSAAIFARDVLRLPVRIVFTSAAQRRHSAVPRALIRQMDAVVATTDRAGTLVPKLAAIVPHGVDTERFVPSADRQAAWRELGLPGRFGIGIVGRIRHEKGTDLFVESMCKVLPRLPDFTAVILGRAMPEDAGFERQLKARIEQCGLSNRILFQGELPRDQMPTTIRGLSMLVAPARYEGYGMTPLEAMASGVAVVATDTGVYRSIITEGETGFVAPIGDQESLTHAIETLTTDPEKMHAMGTAACRYAVAHLSLEGEIDGYSDVYNRLWQGETFAA